MTGPGRHPAASQAARLQRAEKLLQDAVSHAEWQDKHLHPVGGETYQCWRLTIYLPVRLSESDKSPEAALLRALGDGS